jgi:hypothetical protein
MEMAILGAGAFMVSTLAMSLIFQRSKFRKKD